MLRADARKFAHVCIGPGRQNMEKTLAERLGGEWEDSAERWLALAKVASHT